MMALLVFVCAIAARPMIQLNSDLSDDVYYSWNIEQLPVGYLSSASNSPILQSENNLTLPLPLRKDRLKSMSDSFIQQDLVKFIFLWP